MDETSVYTWAPAGLVAYSYAPIPQAGPTGNSTIVVGPEVPVPTPLALALLLAAVPPTSPGDPLDALILGGGKTTAEAQQWLGHWRAVTPELEGLFALAPGYPKVVESSTLPGLKAGFHVVVLGFCPAAQREAPHRFAKAVFPGVYAKPVTGQSAACPEVAPGHRLEDAQGLVQGTHRLAVLALAPKAPEGSVILRFLLFKEERMQRSGTAQHLGTAGGETRYQARLETTKRAIVATVTETKGSATTRSITEFGVADGEFDIQER